MQGTVKKRAGTDLTEGPIMKTLLTFAIPIVLTNLIQQLYSMVDVMVIGQFVGTIGTVGVNTGGEIADLVTPVAMGFSTAGQIYIAQLVGARDEGKIKKTINTLMTFMLLISMLLGAVTILFATPILRVLNCPQEAIGQARVYMITTACGMPFIFGYNAVVGILRGMGESRKPLLFIIVAAVINIVLDVLLVAAFQLGAFGTAIATVVSQLGSFAAALYFLSRHKERFGYRLSLRSVSTMDREILWIMVRLGIPQVVRSLLVRFSMLWVNATANSYGMTVSAANSVGNKIQKFLDVFIQGVDTAAAAMIGQNLGARKTERAGKVTLCAWYATLVCAAAVSALVWLFPRQIFGIFNPDPAVIDIGVIYLHLMTIHFFVSATVGSFQAMVTGCGFVSLGFAIGILDGVICKIGLSLFFVNVMNMGYVGLFWGVCTSRILPAILCIAYYCSGKWKTRKLLTEK